MRATQPILLALWLQRCYAHHRFVATYLSILLRDNGHYFRIYSKSAYPSKLQHLLLVKVQPSGSQTFMGRRPLLSLTGEYLIYPWHFGYAGSRQSYQAKVSVVAPVNSSVAPKRGRGPRLRNPGPATLQLQLGFLNYLLQLFRKLYSS